MNGLKDYEDLFALLNSENVKFIVIGAYAVGFHAQPRATGDIDIFISSTKTNAQRLLTAVEKFGYKDVGLKSRDFETKGNIIQLGYPPFRIDFITDISGVDFRDAWKRRVKGMFGKQQIYFISKRDLIKNKQTSGRTRDLFDLELLGYKEKKKKR